MSRKIIHIDMDCFFAAVEMRDFPELKTKPIAVGGESIRRGVIATCNYEARKYGVRSAMATAQALKLCPKLVLQPVRMEVYKQESQHIRNIFSDYSDCIEPLSLDEAYLDVTHTSRCQGSATWIAREIRQRIQEERGLTASAGVAPNKSLAKIASDWHKPNGQKVILPEAVSEFVLSLPVRKLFGVGPKMEQKLTAIGIHTCAQLQKLTLENLNQLFGNYGQKLYELCRGIDERPVNPNRIRKSISVEETFSQDLPDIQSCIDSLPGLLIRLQKRLDRAGNIDPIHGLFVKLKFKTFQQTTIECIGTEIDETAYKQLLAEGYLRKNLPVRLIGVGVKLKHQPIPSAIQLSLFE
ncbi:DNA polymerase IV [Legionella sp. W05-934-2]|jgi:DNA polymerase-4|uniref:DNA polymerase IV n=1 Tax=Legionella sp. W05-934-2 TaxID=1198649 RepID=UPI003461AA7C